ncbi:MAG: efflux RND transporter periplasmic adaptor subunit [Candidatus Eremiobacteraeota bacterium]|nr:efflux RND transporter periplasmic adaptor subunit [Candidatus Eremiobacteraeota bacterium]
MIRHRAAAAHPGQSGGPGRLADGMVNDGAVDMQPNRHPLWGPKWPAWCIAGMLAICSAGCARPGEQARAASSAQAAPPAVVQTSSVRAARVDPELSLSGLIAPYQNVAISSNLNEPATGVFVHEGDAVARGQVLATFDATDLQANVDGAERSAAEADLRTSQTAYQSKLAIAQGLDGLHSAQDTVAQALFKVMLDKRNLARDRTLLANGYVSRQQVDGQLQQLANDLAAYRSAHSALRNTQTTVEVNGTGGGGLQATTISAARAAASSAHAQASEARAQLAKATITSPIDGTVVNRNLNPGEYPGGRTLFTIQDMALVYAILNATTSQVFNVRAGDAVDIAIGHGNVPSARGTVVAVLGQSDPGSTNFTIKARVVNPHVFQSGMVVTGLIHLKPASGISVPTTAFTDYTHSHIVAVRDGMAKTVPVHEVAESRGRSIVTGLRSGERIVDNGQLGIVDGQRVAAR